MNEPVEQQAFYPRLTRLFDLIAADNGSCTADEVEAMLADCSDEELDTLSAGEHHDQQGLLAHLRQTHDEHLVRALEHFLSVAFDGQPFEPDPPAPQKEPSR